MNLRQIRDSLLGKKRISDLKKSEQTDEVKEELYKLTQQFVRKYQPRYYVQYKGELDDLVSDFYLEFLTPKSREKGKEESLLDKFDPSITTLPYLVKIAVQRMLIDRSRKDKGEVNYTEKYDEETGELSLDYIAEKTTENDIQLEDIEFSDEQVAELKDLYSKMPEKKKEAFLKYYQDVKGVLAPNFRALFKDLLNEMDWSKVRVIVTGTGPSFSAEVREGNSLKEKKEYRAAHRESLIRKILKDYPDIKEEAIEFN